MLNNLLLLSMCPLLLEKVLHSIVNKPQNSTVALPSIRMKSPGSGESQLQTEGRRCVALSYSVVALAVLNREHYGNQESKQLSREPIAQVPSHG